MEGEWGAESKGGPETRDCASVSPRASKVTEVEPRWPLPCMSAGGASRSPLLRGVLDTRRAVLRGTGSPASHWHEHTSALLGADESGCMRPAGRTAAALHTPP